MIADPATLRIIARWLNDLSDLVRHAEARPEEPLIELNARLLGKVLPSGAFNLDSLEHVAAGSPWWPEYGVLQPMLLAWWYDHRPPGAPLMLDEQERAEHLGVLDLSWLAYYRRRQSAGLTAERRANLDSLLRRYSPEAWRVIRPPMITDDRPDLGQMAELRAAFVAHVEPPPPVDPPPPPKRAPGPTPEQLQAMRAEAIQRLHEAAARNVR